MALADNRFQLVLYPVAFTFTEAAAGAPQRLTVQSPGAGKPNIFVLMPEPKLTPDQLTSYAGTYLGKEIDPAYRIVVENSGLVLQRLKSKPEKLQPTVHDHFNGLNGDIHFERDASGNVTGFVLTAGRIKNFRFSKAAQM